MSSTSEHLTQACTISHAYQGAIPPAATAPAAMAPALGTVPTPLFEGLEVTQAIQNMAHAVPLIVEKTTVVRVYLGITAPGPVTLRGELQVRHPAGSGTWRRVPSINSVIVNPAENNQLRLKREDFAKSLNFVLPATTTAAGNTEVRLSKLQKLNPVQVLPTPAGAQRTVAFQAAAPLRIRVLGIRYQGGVPAASHEPRTFDFWMIRSWLARAYPVAQVVWSHVIVDGPLAWPFTASQMNAFLSGIRYQDVLHGRDARTHYFGLVDDAAGAYFMRGQASGIPTTADPSTVASGPTGTQTWGWDNDGTYGDWYTGHELGHTLGRFHAEFCGAAGGKPYPFDNGQISNNNGEFVGFDCGDQNFALPMRALPGVIWHDVMTYCSYQWLSSFTYTGIRDRLLAEDALSPSHPSAGPAPPAGGHAMAGTIHVVATINVTKKTGELRSVMAHANAVAPPVAAPPAGAAPQYAVRLLKTDGTAISDYPAKFLPDLCREAGQDETGLIDVAIPQHADAGRLQLLINGAVVDTFTPGGGAGGVSSIQAAPNPAAPAGAGAASVGNPVITWTPAAAAPAVVAGTATESYSVQLSADDGKTWQTIGFGLKSPRVTLDRDLIADATKVKIRVTATNGFKSVTTEETFKATDL